MNQRVKKRKFRISVRFFLMFFAFSSIAIGCFSFFISLYFSRILVEKEFASFQTLTSSFLAQSENEIHVMDNVSINILYSSLVKNNFARYLNEPEDKFQNFSHMLEIFVALNGADFSLPMIALYSREGDKIIMANYSIMEKVDMTTQDWVSEADRIKYQKVISRPYESNMLQQSRTVSSYYISLYRALRNENGEDIGYIETGQYAKKIFNSIINHQKQVDRDLKVYVYNEKGDLIFPYGEGTINQEQKDYYRIAGTEGPAREYVNPETGTKELFYSEKSFYTGWTYICVQDIQKILIPVRDISRILLYATIITLLAVTLISIYMSSSITRPIRDLLEKIHTTNIETLSGEKKFLQSAYDEFDDLNDAFHTMSDNLKQSMDELIHSRHREMESRFLALQSQINPHFYYNSLSSIVALTEEHREEEVIKFCDNLSRFMRYTAQNQPGTVTLSTELEYAQKYLYCMKVRYQSSLSYKIHISEELKNIPIPKLIIQPILENALKYGTNCAPPWEISITTESDQEGWYVKISDTGTGFSSESLEKIRVKIKNWNKETATDDTVENGMGLINVYSRWRIFNGEKYFFNIESTETGSTVILGQLRKGVSLD